MKYNQKPCTKTRKVINREKRSQALIEVKPVQGYTMQRMWGRFFWNLPVFLTKCVNEISRPKVVNKFGVFSIKNEIQNSIIILSPRNQTVTGDDGF